MTTIFKTCGACSTQAVCRGKFAAGELNGLPCARLSQTYLDNYTIVSDHRHPSPVKGDPARKDDTAKARADLLPSAPLLAIADVLGFGAAKYSDHNWRGGFASSRLIGAAMRHILAYNDGQDKDPESGLSHLAHAGCCILFLLEQEAKGTGTDDRYKA